MALRDGGERLRASVAQGAAELVGALQALAAVGKLEPPWNAAAFHGASLHFIGCEGRLQASHAPARIGIQHLANTEPTLQPPKMLAQPKASHPSAGQRTLPCVLRVAMTRAACWCTGRV